MSTNLLRGRVHKYGNDIDTDGIIPARYCTSIRVADLAPHALEDVDPSFTKKVKPGDVVVAGRNFGCGSSREVAPLAIQGAGVACVIAHSFARIFYRNAINIGLPILVAPDAAEAIADGSELEVNLSSGQIRDLSKGGVFMAAPFPDAVQEIIKAGGMIGYVQRRLTGREVSRR
jgi:3-isopropylmalate/(R)-2-methylmalate dehydratase small subunit